MHHKIANKRERNNVRDTIHTSLSLSLKREETLQHSTHPHLRKRNGPIGAPCITSIPTNIPAHIATDGKGSSRHGTI